MDNLRIFETNNLNKLFLLSKKLTELGFFANNLNHIQYKLVDFILNKDDFIAWKEFLNGNLYINLVNDEDIELDLNLNDLMKKLPFKVRSLLYEFAIDNYYNSTEYPIDWENLLVEEVKSEEKPKIRDEDDDYDDDEDDEDEVVEETNENNYNDDHQLVMDIPKTLFKEIDEENNSQIIKNFNKVYHSFEYDKQTLAKQKKLEKYDKQLENFLDKKESGEMGDDQDHSDENASITKRLGGVNSINLQNLLNMIEVNREKLNLNDFELRTLINDVKKNRSKWSNDDKVGQEELYEACERVITDLRNYTEHSTPFLHKVSKREAPNYYSIIKKPMDLNTVLKKLKNIQYNSKKEFVDDLQLIWSNCLMYNSDPKHFIRTHALAMQKKAIKLINLIPDIVIRDRVDEKEEDEENVHGKSVKGRKRSKNDGFGNKALKRAETESQITNEDEEKSVSQTDTITSDVTKDETPVDSTTNPTPAASGTELPTNNNSTPLAANVIAKLAVNTPNTPNSMSTPVLNDEDDDQMLDDEKDDTKKEDEQEQDDSEFHLWQNLTSKSRYNYCSKRNELFTDNKLQVNQDAILRNSNDMLKFNNYLINKQLISKSKNFLDNNDEPYLIEYDIGNGLPTMKYLGIDDDEFDRQENYMISEIINNDRHMKDYSKFKNMSGLNKIFTENITEMQEIRKLCFKVSLIRQMQNQSFVHHTQMKAPEFEKVSEQDIDPVSNLSNHEMYSKQIQYDVLRKNVGKILMQNGFELAGSFAINALTQIAEDFFGNLIQTLKMKLERQSQAQPDKNPMEKILLITLLENGVDKPDELYNYIMEKIVKQHTKLIDLRNKLSNFLKELLKPTLQDLSEAHFNDNSEQFVSGDFISAELGEDFFGFKELGLAKEFNMLSSSIPLHLLHSRLNNSLINQISSQKQNKYQDLLEFQYTPVSNVGVTKNQIKLLSKYWSDNVEKTRSILTKLKKKNNDGNINLSEFDLIEDEELPQKQRNIRPRLPPTGKISGIKKKPVSNGFWLDD